MRSKAPKQAATLPWKPSPTSRWRCPKTGRTATGRPGVALGLARTLGMPPRDVAAKLVRHLPVGGDALIAKADIAGPGFVNLTLRADWLGGILQRIMEAGTAFGQSDGNAGQSVIVEFVSTNPNGPITVAGGRNAALGDTLCSLLSLRPAIEVWREYYINDALNSVQMNNFGRSVLFRYRELLGHQRRAAR